MRSPGPNLSRVTLVKFHEPLRTQSKRNSAERCDGFPKDHEWSVKGEPPAATMAIDGSANADTSSSYFDGVAVDNTDGARAESEIQLA